MRSASSAPVLHAKEPGAVFIYGPFEDGDALAELISCRRTDVRCRRSKSSTAIEQDTDQRKEWFTVSARKIMLPSSDKDRCVKIAQHKNTFFFGAGDRNVQ